METSVRNYVTKTVTKMWVRDPRNHMKSKQLLHELLDNTDLYRVRGKEFIEVFAVADDENKILFAVGGRDIHQVREIERLYLSLGYVIALHGCVEKEVEHLFPSIADGFIKSAR